VKWKRPFWIVTVTICLQAYNGIIIPLWGKGLFSFIVLCLGIVAIPNFFISKSDYLVFLIVWTMNLKMIVLFNLVVLLQGCSCSKTLGLLEYAFFCSQTFSTIPMLWNLAGHLTRCVSLLPAHIAPRVRHCFYRGESFWISLNMSCTYLTLFCASDDWGHFLLLKISSMRDVLIFLLFGLLCE
jgi:hypothetical protein